MNTKFMVYGSKAILPTDFHVYVHSDMLSRHGTARELLDSHTDTARVRRRAVPGGSTCYRLGPSTTRWS
jgi:hypothetical protein